MNKPIFKKSRGRPPWLQLKILKGIVICGQLSKTEAAEHCAANYGDVSDAIDALVRKHFVKYSEKRRKQGSSSKFHKVYKVTENGLRYLLRTKLTPEVFWRAIALVCISTKKPITRSELEDYYIRFERDYLGHFSIPGYLFLTQLFDDILEQWFQSHSLYSLSLSQIVIECLALHGPLTLENLIEKTNAQQDEIVKAIDNYSIYENFTLKSILSPNTDKTHTKRKNIYLDFILHFLIVVSKNGNKEKFELSIFGVLLAIALVRHYYELKVNAKEKNPALFYQHMDEKGYLDSIVQNYKDKIPLIFGKWELLKTHLGQIMLYDAFDFLIYNARKSNLLTSILLGGNKEFYDDVHTLTYNATMKLMPVYIEGKKLREYPVIETDVPELSELRDIRKIEHIFSYEVCLLFYLDLNRIVGYSHPELRQHPILKDGKLELPPETEEIYRLGSPKQRLMAILTKDNDIKEWFSSWIESLVKYREYTSDRMSNFYKEVKESHKNVHSPIPIEKNMEAMIYVPHREFDMAKVCSDIESVYDC